MSGDECGKFCTPRSPPPPSVMINRKSDEKIFNDYIYDYNIYRTYTNTNKQIKYVYIRKTIYP